MGDGGADLKERVLQFKALRLPGQPISVHMGTSYLVNDLWNEIQRLRKALADENEACAKIADASAEVDRYDSRDEMNVDPIVSGAIEDVANEIRARAALHTKDSVGE